MTRREKWKSLKIRILIDMLQLPALAYEVGPLYTVDALQKIYKVHSTVRGNGWVGSLANNEIQVFVGWSEAAI